tara:strand:- start:1080 stop:1337 length:258 start_codon:yes stop_codon:yes gene_type:complete
MKYNKKNIKNAKELIKISKDLAKKINDTGISNILEDSTSIKRGLTLGEYLKEIDLILQSNLTWEETYGEKEAEQGVFVGLGGKCK